MSGLTANGDEHINLRSFWKLIFLYSPLHPESSKTQGQPLYCVLFPFPLHKACLHIFMSIFEQQSRSSKSHYVWRSGRASERQERATLTKCETTRYSMRWHSAKLKVVLTQLMRVGSISTFSSSATLLLPQPLPQVFLKQSRKKGMESCLRLCFYIDFKTTYLHMVPSLA